MTDTIVIPDLHPLVKRALTADDTVRHLVRDRVYAGEYPTDGVELPAVRFRFLFVDPITAPTGRWWVFTGDVVCHADSEQTVERLAGAVLNALVQLEGTSHTEGVIQGVTRWGVQTAPDGEWTPSKPKRTVTVTLTARPA